MNKSRAQAALMQIDLEGGVFSGLTQAVGEKYTPIVPPSSPQKCFYSAQQADITVFLKC